MTPTVIDVRLDERQFELAGATIELITRIAPHFSVEDALDAIFITGLRTIASSAQEAIDKAKEPAA